MVKINSEGLIDAGLLIVFSPYLQMCRNTIEKEIIFI